MGPSWLKRKIAETQNSLAVVLPGGTALSEIISTGPLFPIGGIEHLISMNFVLLRFVIWLLRAYKYRKLRP